MSGYEALVVIASTNEVDMSQRHEAFGELVNRFQDMGYNFAYNVLGDFHLAQDAVQEAFVTAYKKLDQLREPKAFPGWLKQIIMTQCNRLVRGKHLSTNPIEATDGLMSPELDPAITIENLELRGKVLEAIQALPEREQVVTKLFYLNGYSQKEIAKLLELPLTTVKKRLQYARRHLKGIMASMIDTLYPPPAPPLPVPVPIPVSPTRRNEFLRKASHFGN